MEAIGMCAAEASGDPGPIPVVAGRGGSLSGRQTSARCGRRVLGVNRVREGGCDVETTGLVGLGCLHDRRNRNWSCTSEIRAAVVMAVGLEAGSGELFKWLGNADHARGGWER